MKIDGMIPPQAASDPAETFQSSRPKRALEELLLPDPKRPAPFPWSSPTPAIAQTVSYTILSQPANEVLGPPLAVQASYIQPQQPVYVGQYTPLWPPLPPAQPSTAPMGSDIHQNLSERRLGQPIPPLVLPGERTEVVSKGEHIWNIARPTPR